MQWVRLICGGPRSSIAGYELCAPFVWPTAERMSVYVSGLRRTEFCPVLAAANCVP